MKIAEKMNWVQCLVFFSIIVGTPTIVRAELEDILSKFKANISLQEQYSNNINLSHTNKIGDYITTISPEIIFSTGPKSPVTGEFRQAPTAEDRFGLNFDFSAGFNFYAKEREDNFISLSGILNGWYALSQNLNFGVRDYLIRSDQIREPDFSATAIQGEFLPSRTTKRTPYTRNVFEPSLRYQFGKEDFFTIDYQNNVYNIQSRSSEDSMENTINSNINYWFDVRNGVSFQYNLAFSSFQNSADTVNPSPDLVRNTATGRYTYRFNPKTSVFANYTQSWLNYDNPGIDYVAYTPSIGVNHAFSPTLSGSVQLGYYWAIPERGSTARAPFYAILFTQNQDKTTYTVSVQGGYTVDVVSAQNKGFTQYHRVLGTITRQLLQKMTVGLTSSYEWYKSPGVAIGGVKEKDRIWTIGSNATYQILRWLNVSLHVSRQQDRSNVPDRSYSEYSGMIKITATY